MKRALNTLSASFILRQAFESRRALPNLDLARLGFLALAQGQEQHAILQVSVHVFHADSRRERERAAEVGVAALVQQRLAPALLHALLLLLPVLAAAVAALLALHAITPAGLRAL